MATNPYFKNTTCPREQDLHEDLLIEMIGIYGQDVKYIPRTIVSQDNIFGEDPLSTFDIAADVEMYVKNVEGWEGEGDVFSKFGLEIRDEITFTVAKKRFEQIRTEKLLLESGTPYQLESANTNSPGIGDSILLESGSANNYTITETSPLIGSLIYFPLVGKLFEVMFVEHESIFYSFGRLNTYDLKCELFRYSSERLDTGIADIDIIETDFSLDTTNFNYLLEDGGLMLRDHHTGGAYVLESFRIEDFDATANNEIIQITAENVIDFSERHPFSQLDRF